jgi:hypothetical protein
MEATTILTRGAIAKAVERIKNVERLVKHE